MKNHILNETSRGLLFFVLFFRKMGQEVRISENKSNMLRNPFYPDKNPSFHLYYNEERKIWNFKDFGSSDYAGDVFAFAGHCYKMDPATEFPELLHKIDVELKKMKEDYGDSIGEKSWEPTKRKLPNEKVGPPIYETTPFSKEGLEYWEQYGVTQQILINNRVKEIVSYTLFTGSKPFEVKPEKGELIFAYEGNDYAKIYHPAFKNRPRTFRYLGNKPEDYAFGLEDYYEIDDILILAAGEKDVLVLQSLGINAFCLSSEVAKISRSLEKDIYYSGAKLAVLYDIDETGLKEGEKRSKENGAPNIILPDILKQQGGKDISDWVRLKLPIDTIHNLISEAHQKIIESETSFQNAQKANNANNSTQSEIESETPLENSEKASNANNSTADSNPFPIEVFPQMIREIIHSMHLHLRLPIDYFAGGVLAAITSAIGKNYQIEIIKGWYERAAIYLTLVGDPSMNKSRPLSIALAPIIEWDEMSLKKYKADNEAYEKRKVESRKMNQIEPNRKPFWQRNLVGDITNEALIKVLENNSAGIALYSDELKGWVNNFNKYNKGSDQEFWLTNWSGGAIIVDRLSREPMLIRNYTQKETQLQPLFFQIAS